MSWGVLFTWLHQRWILLMIGILLEVMMIRGMIFRLVIVKAN